MDMAERYAFIKQEVAECCATSGRNLDEVRIIAVSKTVGLDQVAQALAAGVTDFGENRPEGLLEKQEKFPEAIWHFIGNIQSRRIPDIVSHANVIHSVYKSSHLPLIDRAAKACEKTQKILLEVNVSGEESKGGVHPNELESFLKESLNYSHIQVCGLMTMAPQGDLVRAEICFKSLAQLLQEMRSAFSGTMINQELRELSMGMSEDWREAIASGATMVRIGRAIFDDTFIS